jgi:hypothetical protein
MKNTIGSVRSIDDGFGFVLYDHAGKPCASFVYADQETAEYAADSFSDVLDGAKIGGLAIR